MRKVGLNLAVGLLLSAVGAVLVATPAQAASSQCQNGRVCVWENASFSGGFASFSGSVQNFAGLRYDNGHSINDSVSSLWNRTTRSAFFYPASGFSGGYDLFEPAGGSRQNLAVDSQHDSLQYNDVFSSLLVS